VILHKVRSSVCINPCFIGNNGTVDVKRGGGTMIQMSQIPVKKVYLNSKITSHIASYEFSIDCGAVYFGAIYDDEGNLQTVDQYFYTERYSRDDLESAAVGSDFLSVDSKDYRARTYLLTKYDGKNEWLRFHAVVPQEINPEYFNQKYIGD
jgi:hypothetical protein